MKNSFDGKNSLVLFDGICSLCTTSVQFILKRDSKKRFLFASLQSPFGQDILEKYKISGKVRTVVLIEKDKVFTKSTAALIITRHLNGFWPLFYVFILLPKCFRDRVYDFIAKNRFRWFPKHKVCQFSISKFDDRFLS